MKLYNTFFISQMLNCSYFTLYRIIKELKIDYIKKGNGNAYMYSFEQVLQIEQAYSKINYFIQTEIFKVYNSKLNNLNLEFL